MMKAAASKTAAFFCPDSCIFAVNPDIKKRRHPQSGYRRILYVISCCSRLQLSFSENGPWSSSEEKERVAETDDTCYGKG
ncbi:MAG: hypothetical protein IKO02_05695, partial [Lentisphaeria bacterium]|nr:hypothetical protein [Lentisphaeria bacterium]